MQDLIDELDREAADVRSLGVDAPRIVRAVGPLLNRLGEDPRAVALLDELHVEGRALIASLVDEEARFVARAKTIADGIPPEPFDLVAGDERGGPMRTLASVAHLIAKDTEIRDALPAGDVEDPSKATELLLALRVRLAAATNETTKLALESEVNALQREHKIFWQKISLALLDHAGIAALRFPHVLRQMTPSAIVGTNDWAEEQREIYAEPETIFSVAHGLPVGGAVFDNDPHPSHVMFMARQLSADMTKVLAEMRRRAQKGHSRLALLRRYKTLCEWYARDDVRKLSEIADGAARPEDRLVEHLARFLFEHGLNPLSTPLTGRVRADLVDTSQPRFTLYIEAKQHEDAADAKVQTRKGLRQIADTANVLDPLGVKEAFLVVFRRRGELISFVPDTLNVGRLQVHVLAVDVAPWDEVGSRESRNPRTIDPRTLIGAGASADDGHAS